MGSQRVGGDWVTKHTATLIGTSDVWIPSVISMINSWRDLAGIGISKYSYMFIVKTLEKEMATHSSVLAWRIPGIREPSGLPSMGRIESDTTKVTQQQQWRHISAPLTKQQVSSFFSPISCKPSFIEPYHTSGNYHSMLITKKSKIISMDPQLLRERSKKREGHKAVFYGNDLNVINVLCTVLWKIDEW